MASFRHNYPRLPGDADHSGQARVVDDGNGNRAVDHFALFGEELHLRIFAVGPLDVEENLLAQLQVILRRGESHNRDDST